MARVPTYPKITYDGVVDESKVHAYLADRQTVDGNGYGASRSMPIDEWYKVLNWKLITVNSHGLLAADEGKTLMGGAVLDDTSSSDFPTAVLAKVIDAHTLRVAPACTTVEIPVALLTDGATYDISVDGRYVFWDQSAGLYVPDKPSDSAPHIPDILELVAVTQTIAVARVRPFFPCAGGNNLFS